MKAKTKPFVHYVSNYIIRDIHPITIDLIGVGGSGSNVLRNLARINAALRGLRRKGLHVTVWDGDTISEANIGRQNFYPGDIGLNKAVTLTQRINRAFGTAWEGNPVMFNKKTAKTVGNIFISCVDKIDPRFEIGEIFHNSIYQTQGDTFVPFYWIDMGNSSNSGQVILGSKKIQQPVSDPKYIPVEKLLTFSEMFNKETFPKNQDKGPSCSTLQALNSQGLFINSLLSEFTCDLLWKLLFEYIIDYKGLYYNGNLMIINKIPIDGKKT